MASTLEAHTLLSALLPGPIREPQARLKAEAEAASARLRLELEAAVAEARRASQRAELAEQLAARRVEAEKEISKVPYPEATQRTKPVCIRRCGCVPSERG